MRSAKVCFFFKFSRKGRPFCFLQNFLPAPRVPRSLSILLLLTGCLNGLYRPIKSLAVSKTALSYPVFMEGRLFYLKFTQLSYPVHSRLSLSILDVPVNNSINKSLLIRMECPMLMNGLLPMKKMKMLSKLVIKQNQLKKVRIKEMLTIIECLQLNNLTF